MPAIALQPLTSPWQLFPGPPPVLAGLERARRQPWWAERRGRARPFPSAKMLDLLDEADVDQAGRAQRTEEQALVARCLAGDAAAFDDLVEMHGAMVYNLAYRQLGDRDEALDLSQEVFLRVYKSLSSFRGESSLKTWIFRIVINLSRNRQKWWRARRRDQTVSLDAPEEHGDASGGATRADRLSDGRKGPEEHAENRDLQRLVSQAMEELSFEHRQILVLRDMEDLSYDEIAAVLGMSEGTVKSRLSRARAQLKQVLQGRI